MNGFPGLRFAVRLFFFARRRLLTPIESPFFPLPRKPNPPYLWTGQANACASLLKPPAHVKFRQQSIPCLEPHGLFRRVLGTDQLPSTFQAAFCHPGFDAA